MTLDEFIYRKPKELRLGQWFVNCYWKGADSYSQRLYQLDGVLAKWEIQLLMNEWQWDTLPEPKP